MNDNEQAQWQRLIKYLEEINRSLDTVEKRIACLESRVEQLHSGAYQQIGDGVICRADAGYVAPTTT